MLLFTPWAHLLQGKLRIRTSCRTMELLVHFACGLPTLMLGFFLLAPIFVVFLERVVGPVLAAMMGLRFALLRQQLSGGVWRAAGTCAALMVGLAILIAMETQGVRCSRMGTAR